MNKNDLTKLGYFCYYGRSRQEKEICYDTPTCIQIHRLNVVISKLSQLTKKTNHSFRPLCMCDRHIFSSTIYHTIPIDEYICMLVLDE